LLLGFFAWVLLATGLWHNGTTVLNGFQHTMMLGSWFFCLGDFCNGVVAQWNNSVEWFTTHYDALWDLGTTTVMSLGQALKLFAFWLCFF
jgi:hypothetical protein